MNLPRWAEDRRKLNEWVGLSQKLAPDFSPAGLPEAKGQRRQEIDRSESKFSTCVKSDTVVSNVSKS